MKAIIPAAGVGIRLRPHTYSIPKILLNVAGKPMIAHLTDELVNVKEIDTIIIIVGHLGDKVQDFINDRYASNKNVKFKFVEQKEMNGLGHAVYQAKEFLKNEPVVIILGDTIFEFKMDDFFHLENSAIGVKDVDDPQRFGVIETRNGFISKMVEKPSGPEVTPSKKAIAGLYLIKNSDRLFRSLEYIMEHNIRTQNEFQLTDALQNMIENGEKMIPFEIQNWFDCGKPETLLRCNYLMRGVYVQPGPHTVEFRFEPPIGTFYVSLVAVFVGFLFLGYLALGRGKDTTPVPALPAQPRPDKQAARS